MGKKEIATYTFVIVVIGTIILSVIIFGGEGENRIERIIEKNNIKPGEKISVTLDVSIKDDDTYYAFEEYLPSGWTIIDDGGGSTINPNVLRWVINQDAQNTQYIYTLKAPDLEGEYITSGIYMFEGDTTPITTEGNKLIKVSL